MDQVSRITDELLIFSASFNLLTNVIIRNYLHFSKKFIHFFQEVLKFFSKLDQPRQLQLMQGQHHILTELHL